ncbi:YdeI/OmpD-associated family protein [Caldibacillus lycopersici]|uniref:YdeI/OmpD-associated family protein n=1 Tax=Perspicuibacillus lycopersici TaxID=1325689 RepID=A0AAE3LMC0_9BACI|nr:YdeI/OmpD-associated family protein [Perspicuibacillus lycopersici]MCU9613420.1 YdeI/OmpD-associated family protein [Perspicuibacillus lycopersici]
MTKSIVAKLSLQKYEKAAVLNLPNNSNYLEELTVYDTGLNNNRYDLIFAFVVNSDELKRLVDIVVSGNYLTNDGYLYIAYPKKGNKKYSTYIHRDDLFTILGSEEDGFVKHSNIKFARMVGLDDIFTVVGLKVDSKGKHQISSKASQRVDDYMDSIPLVERDLQDSPQLLAFYQSLTPGYRKDWARYVYSAKQEETKAKRRDEMKMILAAGYKSRDLYRRENS